MAAKFSADYGLTPDLWQRFVLDDWLGRRDNKWSALSCGLSVPRQNGKNALLEMRELFGSVGLGERILHSAHEVKTAQKHFRRLLHFFGNQANDPGAKFPELNALVERVRLVNGQEAILLSNGGSIEVVARSKNSGRGFTVDVLVMDEAQELDDDALEALMPTTSAAPLGNPQWIFTGTPPGPSAAGEVFTRVHQEALSENPGSLVWHEWSVSGDVDLDDRNVWRMTNPALDTGRLQEAVVAGERARFSADGFARERLGKWASKGARRAEVSAGEWSRLADDEIPDGRRVFGVKFSMDGSLIGLAAAIRPDEGPIMIVPVRVASTAEGLSWLVDFLEDRRDRIAQIVIDGPGAPGLVDALGAVGIKPRSKVKRVTSRLIRIPAVADVKAAHSMFRQAIYEQDLLHDGSEALTKQVAGAVKRNIGTGGGWAWSPLGESDDVTLLDAVTYAFWGAKTTTRGRS